MQINKIVSLSITTLIFFIFTVPVFGQGKNLSELSSSDIQNTEISKHVPDPRLAMADPNYPVTAGDVYALAFAAGNTAVSYSVPVDSSYSIRIANLGVIDCRDLSFLELKKQVENLVQRNYPMSGVQFVLQTPASFFVTVTGEVKETKEQGVWALSRLSSVVEDSLTEYSSQRNIKIISQDGIEKTYDLFKAKRFGDMKENPYMRPGDKIVVDRIERKVFIGGSVERPGSYELLPGENIKSLIEVYANGLTVLGDISRIELYRPQDGSPDAGKKYYLGKEEVERDFNLICYDRVTVYSYNDLLPVVFLEGAVFSSASESGEASLSNRITATFNEGEDYAFFMRRNKSMFSSVSDLKNAYLVRGTEIIPMNLEPMLYDSSFNTGIEMKSSDTIIIPFKQYFVTVSGAVYNPGRYPYIPDRTWDYYISLAGGFIETKNAREAVVITDINGKKLSKTDKITPETIIEAKSNSALYFFNQYAPILTTLISVISTSISVLAVTGVF